MPIDLVSEEELRAALRPYRADPADFEAGVRTRIETAEKNRSDEPLARLSPLLRSAAAFLPLEVLAGCKGAAVAAKLTPAGGAYKLLGYLAFPAISLFVLLGAMIFSAVKIRGIQDQAGAGLADAAAIQEATNQWWQRHKWGGWAVFAGSMLLMLFGATWILFLFYLVSFGILLYVLNSLAKVGVGNRQVIGRSCGMGLMFLGQFAGFAGIGKSEIHLLDQQLISAVFYVGVLVLLPFIVGRLRFANKPVEPIRKTPRWFWVFLAGFWCVHLLLIGAMWFMVGDSLTLRIVLAVVLALGALAPLASVALNARLSRRPIGNATQWWLMGFMTILLVPLIVWSASPILWPATPSRIKQYVESFDPARLSMVRRQRWEIAAQWAVDSQLYPDLSHARRLMANEISGEQNAFILNTGFRMGLVQPEQLQQLRDYESSRRSLFAKPPREQEVEPINSLNHHDWVIRAAVMRNDLTTEERDFLEQRLLATLESLPNDPYAVLETPLRVTQLLEAIGRPIDREQYRGMIHDLLRKFHHEKSRRWSSLAGGFNQYLNLSAGSVEATSHAVDLMEIYGVPEDLDLMWTRSFLRPLSNRKLSDEQWVAAATLARLDQLPGVVRPTWLDVLYYERTLLAAMVLVGLCVYATLSSPKSGP